MCFKNVRFLLQCWHGQWNCASVCIKHQTSNAAFGLTIWSPQEPEILGVEVKLTRKSCQRTECGQWLQSAVLRRPHKLNLWNSDGNPNGFHSTWLWLILPNAECPFYATFRVLYNMFGAFPRGPAGFRELREVSRNHFHLSWYLQVPVVTSYGQKP